MKASEALPRIALQANCSLFQHCLNHTPICKTVKQMAMSPSLQLNNLTECADIKKTALADGETAQSRTPPETRMSCFVRRKGILHSLTWLFS